jgi:hypothetical protein
MEYLCELDLAEERIQRLFGDKVIVELDDGKLRFEIEAAGASKLQTPRPRRRPLNQSNQAEPE